MTAVLLWFGKEVLAPEVLSRAYSNLRRRGWRRKVAGRASKLLAFRVSQRRLRRWLRDKSTWDALVHPSPSAVEALVKSADRAVVRRRWPRATLGSDESQRRAAELVESVVREFLSALDPSYAIAVAHAAQMDELQLVRADTAEILSTLDRSADFEANIERLPPGVDVHLRTLHETDRTVAVRMASLLSGDDARGVAEALLRNSPEWLSGSPGSAWATIGEFLTAHRRRDLAASAYERAAEAGIARPARWLAKAASLLHPEQPASAIDLLERAEAVDSDGDLVVSAVRAAVANDVDQLERILQNVPDDDPDLATLLNYRAQAELSRNAVSDAIATLTQAETHSPSAAGVLLAQANAWLHVATKENRAERTEAIKRLRELATRARAERRRWSGPSYEATRVLCIAAILASDWDGVLQVGLPPPAGEATAEEADDPEVLGRVFEAALALERFELATKVADRLTERSTDAFEVAIARAMLADPGDDRIQLLHEAWDLASEGEQRFRVQFMLARAGTEDLPGVEELAETDPDLVTVLRATSDLERGDPAAAIGRLRPERHTSRRAALLLAEAYEESGDIDDAVATLRSSADRFGDPALLGLAAEVLYRADRMEEARQSAMEALGLLAQLPGPRANALRLLIQIEASLNDWPASEAHARVLLQEDPDGDKQVQWALVIALAQQGQVVDAFKELTDRGLEPSSILQALVWLDLHRRFPGSPTTVASILDIAREWADSEQVWAAALITAYEVSRELELPDETVATLHRLTDEFLEIHPDSQMFRRIQFQDTDQLVDQLRTELEGGAGHFESMAVQVHRGRLPYGMLSSAAGRPYAEALLRRAAGALLLVDPDDSRHESELAVAHHLLDGRAVVDASFLRTMFLLQSIWQVVYGQMRSLQMTDVAIHDATEAERQLGLKTTGSMGWDAAAGKPVLSEITPEQAQDLSEGASWIAAEARSHTQLVPWRRLERFPDFELERFGAWLTGLDLAAAKDLPLLADDYALRSLASSLGIQSCGSVALMQTLVRRGLVSVEDFDAAVLQLRRNRAVDLPLDEAHIVALARESDDARGACLLQLSRPRFWVSLDRATTCFGDVLEALALESEDWGVAAVSAATVGVLRLAGPRDGLGLAAGILGLAVVRTALPAEGLVRSCRDSIREELEHEAFDDPLPAAVERMLHALSTLESAAVAAQVVLKRFAGLDNRDRQVVTRVILSNSWQGPE